MQSYSAIVVAAGMLLWGRAAAADDFVPGDGPPREDGKRIGPERGPWDGGRAGGPREWGRRRRPKDAGMMIERILFDPTMREKLDLEEEQVERIRAKLGHLRERGKQLHEELENAALRQAELMTEPEIDEEAVLDAVEATGRIRTELAKLRIQHLLAVKRSLTPEQLERARLLVRKRLRERWKERLDDRERPFFDDRGPVAPPEGDRPARVPRDG